MKSATRGNNSLDGRQQAALNRSTSRVMNSQSTPTTNGGGTPKNANGEIYSVGRFNTPRTKPTTDNDNSIPGEQTNFIVALRLRPLTLKENENKKATVLSIDGQNKALIEQHGQLHTFVYDNCFAVNSQQQEVYNALGQPLLEQALKGFNTSIFAYGQTGTGKTHSILGSLENDNPSESYDSGIVPRFCSELFQQLTARSSEQLVSISFFEIYQEKIFDLLAAANEQRKQLRVREHPTKGPYVEELSQHPISCYEEIKQLLITGNRKRITAATEANDRSSRSHAVVTLTLTQSREEVFGTRRHLSTTHSRVNFVDLAGSERVAVANTTGLRRDEGLKINQSLLTLGRVITALADQSSGKNVFPPYRESLLTWLLKDSLGGDAKSALLATVSPCEDHLEETMSTLRYACQARNIVNVARIKEDPLVRCIRELQNKIEILEKGSVASGTPSTNSTSRLPDIRKEEMEKEIRKLKEQLVESERRFVKAQQEEKEEFQRRKEELETSVSILQEDEQEDLELSVNEISEAPVHSEVMEQLETILNEGDRRVKRRNDEDLLLNTLLEARALFQHMNVPCTISQSPDLEQQNQIVIYRQDTQQSACWSLQTLLEKTGMFRNAMAAGKSRWSLKDLFTGEEIWKKEERTNHMVSCLDMDTSSVFDDTSGLLELSVQSSMGSCVPKIATCLKDLITHRHSASTPLEQLVSSCCKMLELLANPERGCNFLIGLGASLCRISSVLPHWSKTVVETRPLVGSLKNHWLDAAARTLKVLENMIVLILEKTEIQSGVEDLIPNVKKSIDAILSLIGELIVISEVNFGELVSDWSKNQLIAGFHTAHWRVHDAVWQAAESHVGFLLRHLPQQERSAVPDSFGSVTNGKWQLIKACHDIAVQFQVVLEKVSDTADSTITNLQPDIELEFQSSRDKANALFGAAECLGSLTKCLEDPVFPELDRQSHVLEKNVKTYALLVGLGSDQDCTWSELDDFVLSITTLHNVTGEKKRREAMVRGREINFSPIPARLLASPGFSRTKKRLFDPLHSGSEMLEDSGTSFEEDGLSTSAIKKALKFGEPTKSNLKSHNPEACGKKVQFDVPDSDLSGFQ